MVAQENVSIDALDFVSWTGRGVSRMEIMDPFSLSRSRLGMTSKGIHGQSGLLRLYDEDESSGNYGLNFFPLIREESTAINELMVL